VDVELGEIDSARLDGRQMARVAGDMPLWQTVNCELVINLKTAKALAIDVPAALLARADEVVEALHQPTRFALLQAVA
jgi:hypothetical protein